MITADQVKAKLSEVATNNGFDARVQRGLAPRYVEHGRPCCLVAWILHELGLSVGQLRQLDRENGAGGGGVIFAKSRHPLLKRFDSQAQSLLDYVQRLQDNPGTPWSEVVDRALQRGAFRPDPKLRRPYEFDRAAECWAYQPFPWNVRSSATNGSPS